MYSKALRWFNYFFVLTNYLFSSFLACLLFLPDKYASTNGKLKPLSGATALANAFFGTACHTIIPAITNGSTCINAYPANAPINATHNILTANMLHLILFFYKHSLLIIA